MRKIEKYTDINRTLQMLMIQVDDSLIFAASFIPINLQTPYDVFEWLKSITSYKNDPPNTELLQSFPSMMNTNYHNIRGAGDCDCFSIAAISCLFLLKIPCAIVLSGRSKRQPVHIYLMVKDGQRWKPFDLTLPLYARRKFYPYFQIIPIQYTDMPRNEKNKIVKDFEQCILI
jgi:hypothetical protein